MILAKQEMLRPRDVVGTIVYQWVGRARWLPHIGTPLLVIGHRENHVICVPPPNMKRSAGTTYLSIHDVALSCDLDAEYPLVEEMLANYRMARGQIEQQFARMMKDMVPRDLMVRYKERPRIRVRQKA